MVVVVVVVVVDVVVVVVVVVSVRSHGEFHRKLSQRLMANGFF